MRFNKFLPFALVYFFINSVGLPFGLTWMALLGPFFYLWVVLKRKKEIVLPFLLILLPFIIMHVLSGETELRSYAVSMLNITMIYFFCQAVYTFLKQPVDHEWVLRRILIINFIFCFIAIIFYFTPLKNIFWISQDLTPGVDDFLRLKLLAYEASYYAMLFVPVFVFYLLQFLLRQNKINRYVLLLMIFLPLILSFSMGVTGSLLIAGLVTLFIHSRELLPKRRVFNSILNIIVLSGFALFLFIFFFRDNPFVHRVLNLFSGEDTSGQGRTADAFILAKKILEEHNPWWGIGPGQLNSAGADIIRNYYLYYQRVPVAIPNAAAETLLLFGWIGLSLRLFLQLFLFFYTKAWSDYFRLFMFLFMFTYQFTGSFITNAAEYVIWIFAFTNVFPQFKVRSSPTSYLEKQRVTGFISA